MSEDDATNSDMFEKEQNYEVGNPTTRFLF